MQRHEHGFYWGSLTDHSGLPQFLCWNHRRWAESYLLRQDFGGGETKKAEQHDHADEERFRSHALLVGLLCFPFSDVIHFIAVTVGGPRVRQQASEATAT